LYRPSRVTAKVPAVVIGEPLTIRPVGTVIATEVTEPLGSPSEEVAIAVTVLSALIWIRRTALGLAKVKRFEPTVLAPKLVRAPEAVVAPVPPEVIARALDKVRLLMMALPVVLLLARVVVPVKVGPAENTAKPPTPVSSSKEVPN